MDQGDHDDRIVHLLGVMTDVITFVDTVDALSIIQARREVVLFLIQQRSVATLLLHIRNRSVSVSCRSAKYDHCC